MTTEWYRTAFGAVYVELYAHRDEQEARDTVELLASLPGVAPGGIVLDAPCGAGRHVREFALRGFRVDGIDLSADLLRIARRSAGEGVGLARADLRAIPLAGGRYDLVTNLFSSIGYFPDDAENHSVLRELARVCRPGGLVVVDFMNSARVRDRLEEQSERTTAAGHHVRDRRRISGDPARVEKRTEVTMADGRRHEFFESVRLFEPEELRAAMRAAGLSVEQQFGDYRGGPWNTASDRLILVGRRHA